MPDPWRIAAVVIAVLAVVLVAWALFWDRPRGRRRCPRCWYDMAGVDTLLCPECGRTAKSDKRLRRTRRRWRWAIAALPLLAASYGCWHAKRTITYGWIGLAPTTALILIMEPASSDDAELKRYVSGALSTAERELDRRVMAGEVADWQMRLAVRRANIVRVRPTWPEGRALGVRLVVPAWLGQVEVNVARRGEPGSATGYMGGDYQVFEFGPLEPGESTVEFDLDVVVQAVSDRVVRASTSHRVRTVASVEDVISPRNDPETDRAMARAILIGTGHERTGQFANVPFLAIRVVRTNEPLLADLALGVEVEYLQVLAIAEVGIGRQEPIGHAAGC